MGPRYRFLVTPLQRSPSPPSHILLVLAHVSSCCLQFLNPFCSCQRFLAAEVAAGPTGPGGSSQGTGEFRMGGKLECPCSPRHGQSLTLLQLLPSLASSPDRRLWGATGLWLCICRCTARARRSPLHPSCCLEPRQPGQNNKVGVSWMLIPFLSHALSPCTERCLCRDAGESWGCRKLLLRGCVREEPSLTLQSQAEPRSGPAEKTNTELRPTLFYSRTAI